MTDLTVYTGMNAQSGHRLSGVAHLRQSVRDILTTPRGSRVMRRDYGSDLPDLIDAPIGPALIADIAAAVAGALSRYEPRLTLVRVRVFETRPGHINMNLEGQYDGQALILAEVLS